MNNKQCCYCGSTEHNIMACGWGVLSKPHTSDNHAGWEVQGLMPSGWQTIPVGYVPLVARELAESLLKCLAADPVNVGREYRVYEVVK